MRSKTAAGLDSLRFQVLQADDGSKNTVPQYASCIFEQGALKVGSYHSQGSQNDDQLMFVGGAVDNGYQFVRLMTDPDAESSVLHTGVGKQHWLPSARVT